MNDPRNAVTQAREDYRLFVMRVHEGRYPDRRMIELIARIHVRAFHAALRQMIERDLGRAA